MALTGAIIVNRYDVAVALVVAAFLLCLVRRWYVAAAIALGVGFALKVTPAALLPLVLLLAGGPRRWVWPIAGFAGAAFAGFLPYLFVAPQGIWYVFQYHLERPLQIESVLGTPMLLGQALGADWVQVGYSHGSWQLIAAGADLAAELSGVLTFGALVVVYVVLLGRRAQLRAAPEQLPLAVLTLLLALIAFGKVLSPQYFIWILPVLAVVAVRDPARRRSRSARAALDPGRVPRPVREPPRPPAPGPRPGRGEEPAARRAVLRHRVAAGRTARASRSRRATVRLAWQSAEAELRRRQRVRAPSTPA